MTDVVAVGNKYDDDDSSVTSHFAVFYFAVSHFLRVALGLGSGLGLGVRIRVRG